jgi:hypothetical protein
LAALALNQDDRVESSVPLLLEWDDIRAELQKRNPELKNLARQYATGKAGIAEKQNAGQA